MFRIPTAHLQPGMIVARAVATASGAVLLKPGTRIEPIYVVQLQRLGVPAVYVQNSAVPDLAVPDVVTAEVRQEVATGLQATMQGFSTSISGAAGGVAKRFSHQVGTLKESVATIVDQVRSNPQVLLHLTDIRSADEWTLQHSVSVAITSVLVGRQLGLAPAVLQDLGVGALLHDVGKQSLSPAVLKATGPLTPEQQAEYRTHPTLGFEMLKKTPEISLVSAAIAFQHHERWGGGGFPRGIRGTEIHELARIVAAVDQFDNLVTDRVERAGIAPERALLVMEALSKEHFEPRVVHALQQCVAKYPLGSGITLSDGSMGIVIAVDKGALDQPRVRVVRGPDGAPVSAPYDLDLRQSKLTVVGTVRMEGRP